ncbi:MAG: TlyA family RNA methyltransferase [Eubacteriales bacterium]
MRLDAYLAQTGMAPSRTKAQELIQSGRVYIKGKRIDKSAYEVDETVQVEIQPSACTEYVGRGGRKLEAALDTFCVAVNGKVCADIGASTGGFTDCLLKRGAKRVYAIDSGSGQLAPNLAADARVISLENTNARYMDKATLSGESAELVVMDVSFISQKLLYPAIRTVAAPCADIITLIKPQFEAGRAHLGKNGIVKDEKVRRAVVEDVIASAAQFGFESKGVVESPIKGGSGNTEFLLWLKNTAGGA